MKALLQEIRHECRNGIVNIQYNIKRIAEAESVIENAEVEIRKALILIADEQSKMEKAINFLDQLEEK